VVAALAVRLRVALEEVLRAEFSGAVSAGEVLGVPRLAQRCHDLSDDWLLASAAAALLCGGDALLRHVGGEGAQHAVELVGGGGGRGRGWG